MEFVLQCVQMVLSFAFWTLTPEKILFLSRLFCLVVSAGIRWQCPCHLDRASLGLYLYFLLMVIEWHWKLLLLLGSERVSRYWRFPSTLLESDSLCERRELIFNFSCL